MTRTIGMVCYAGFGGSSVVASELALGLCERGHRVHLVTGALHGRVMPRHARLVTHEVRGLAYPLFDQPLYSMALASALVDLGRQQPLDLLHVHYAVPHATSAMLARQVLRTDLRIIVTLHGTDVTKVGRDPSYEPVTRFGLEQADGITTPSRFLKDLALAWLNSLPAEAIEVLPNFVDTARFVPVRARDSGVFAEFMGGPPQGPVLVHVSNLRPVKRPRDLVEILAEVRRELPASLLIVGDGPERAAIAERARALNIRHAVHFAGLRSDFSAELRHADAFVLPSETESFGVAALEAMSSGVPVFGYRVGGLPEVVGEHAGVLVELADTRALARAVVAVVADRPRWDEMAGAGRARAEACYQRAPAIARYEAYYERVLAQPPRRAP